MPNGVILVVEDDPTLQTVVRLALDYLGYRCDVVGTGEEAVARSGDDLLLIFMDIGLPGINGLLATSTIRELESSKLKKHIPIIALTGHASEASCLRAGMDDFLQKPALIADLKRMIEKWA